MSQDIKQKSNGQLRLILPASWIEELTVMAEFEDVSRLQLIRNIIRDALDHQMAHYYDQFTKKHQFEEVLAKMKSDNAERAVKNRKTSWD